MALAAVLVLVAGVYTNNQVVQAGRQFFALSFLQTDGHGEGPNGPRSQQRIALWTGATPFPLSIPFLRVQGLDSQSCFACHNTAGTDVPEGELFATQKPGPVGGAGDFAVALPGNVDFPERLTHILRVPPRAFGSAYLQELALAIVFHAGELGNDTQSDAFPAVDTYLNLPKADQLAVIDFLETLVFTTP